MFTKSIETNESTGRFHIVTTEECVDGSWGYVRRSCGLTLKTQNLRYYFTGITEKGYKSHYYAKKVLKRMLSENDN